jgi:hypothetical protein
VTHLLSFSVTLINFFDDWSQVLILFFHLFHQFLRHAGDSGGSSFVLDWSREQATTL